MAFENSSASDPIDLLQKLVVFLVANGWTSDRSAAEGSGWTATLHKSGNYVHFRAATAADLGLIFKTGAAATFGYGLALYMGTAFSSGATFNDQQTGTPKRADISTEPVGCSMNLSAGPYTNYFFFSDSANNNVVVVVEKASGIYGHIGFGTSLLKAGSWTGGPYFFGSIGGNYAGHVDTGAGWNLTADGPGSCGDAHGGVQMMVRADVDAWTGKWISIYTGTTAQLSNQLGWTGKGGASPVFTNTANSFASMIPNYGNNGSVLAAEFFRVQTSAMDGRANLLPATIYAQRDGSGNGHSVLGEIPNIRLTNGVGNGFSGGEDYLIGSDTFTMFPNFAVKKEV